MIAFTGSVATGSRIMAGGRTADQEAPARARRLGPVHRPRRREARRRLAAARSSPRSSTPARSARRPSGSTSRSRSTTSSWRRRSSSRRRCASATRWATSTSARSSRREAREPGRADDRGADRARRGGAARRRGARRSRRGYFFEPTILELADPRRQELRREIFGPLATFTPVRDVDEAIELANDSDFGLGANIYTSSLETAMRAATEISGRDGLDQRSAEGQRRGAVRRDEVERPRPRARLRGHRARSRRPSTCTSTSPRFPPRSGGSRTSARRSTSRLPAGRGTETIVEPGGMRSRPYRGRPTRRGRISSGPQRR